MVDRFFNYHSGSDGLFRFGRIVDSHEQHGTGDFVKEEIDERMVAPELVRFRWSRRPGHDERRRRGSHCAFFVHSDLCLVHRVVERHVVRATRQR